MATLKHFAVVHSLGVVTIIFLFTAPSNSEDTADGTAHSVPKLFHTAFLVPDVIPVAPQKAIKLFYGDTPVHFGTVLPLKRVKEPPTNITWPALKNAFYTLILYGPDIGAPDIQTQGWNHWLVVNIPGNNLKAGQIHTNYNSVDEDLYRLEGFYRLLFLVYKQPTNESIPVPEKGIKGRLPVIETPALFCLAEFTKTHAFGTPIAGNFFQVEGDQKITE